MLKKIFTLVCISLSLNCYASNTNARDSAIKKGVTLALNYSITCWNSGDLDCFMDLYVKDKNTVYIAGTNFLYGWQAFSDHYRKKYGTDKNGMGHLSITITNIIPIDSKHAFLYGRWHVKKTHEDFSGVTSILFLKVGTKWQVMVDHSNS